MKTEIERVEYDSDDERFNSFSKDAILFEVIGLEPIDEDEDPTEEDEEKFLLFPKGDIVELTEGKFPLESYKNLYQHSKKTYRIGGLEVFIDGFAGCKKGDTHCSISILEVKKKEKEEMDEEKRRKKEEEEWKECKSFLEGIGIKSRKGFEKLAAERGGSTNRISETLFEKVSNCVNKVYPEKKKEPTPKEEEKKKEPVTEKECTSFLSSMGITDIKTFHKWAAKGGHTNKGGDLKVFQTVSNCIDKFIKTSGGARKTRKIRKLKKKQTKKHMKK